ncbi:hypothetical protein OG889_32730 [Streptomyces sp. NBC_00481]|uniref:hypothetical protein n=1 Tax=Streptomyces sp. NBC_00481 TaxID=2975755 RepID=UPI002DD809D8|nr:hypothetical protein [Streptomyces sp. NBC_00481]WRY99039.1 hypothetical protein OG889_32730 [Streptomyces sp. NBC_00481]
MRNTVPGGREPFDFSRWAFLSAPLVAVLAACRVQLAERQDMPAHLMAGLALEAGRIEVRVPAGQDPMERELAVRGLLARWNSIDVRDWPLPMNLAGFAGGAS